MPGYATLAGDTNGGWGMTVLSVYPEDLRRAADDVGAAADTVDRSVEAHHGGLAVPGQRGWATTTQLDAAAQALTGQLRDLAREVAQTASDLHTLATGFISADQEAAQPWRMELATWAR